MVSVTRFENRMIYTLATEASAELHTNLKCLQDCSKEYPIFKEDLARLGSIKEEVGLIKEKANQTKVKT